jgi:uncharacterized protein YlaN (UPF0358 family)
MDEKKSSGNWEFKPEEEIQSGKKVWYKSKENIRQYLMRKYPTEEEVKRLKYVAVRAYIYVIGYNREGFTFQDKELIWDSMLLRYGIENGYSTKYTFPLVNVDNLTQLAYQLDENNWKDPEFMKKFGIGKGRIILLDKTERNFKVYRILDNLANQILAYCIIVANRLVHGVDKIFEEMVMTMAFGYQRCSEFLKLKLVQKNNRQILIDRVNQALAGDKELLQKLSDLPFVSEWVKEQIKSLK